MLMIYLKHNRKGPDVTNRTDAITGVSSLTFQVVAAWCARENSTVSAARAAVLLGALGFASFENFVQCEEATLRRYVERLANSAGEEMVMLAAHRHFKQQAQGMSGLQEIIEQSNVEAEVANVFAAVGLDVRSFCS